MNSNKTPDQRFLDAQIALIMGTSDSDLDEMLQAIGFEAQDLVVRGASAVQRALTAIEQSEKASAALKSLPVSRQREIAGRLGIRRNVLTALGAWGTSRQGLREWFGLSYATWLTLPRSMMHEMPEEWQQKMADLLFEWDETWDSSSTPSPFVIARKDNRFTKWPAWLLNYRHPDKDQINKLREKP